MSQNRLSRLFLIYAALAVVGDVCAAGTAAFVWANRPTAGRYEPMASYSYNPAGGAVQITRSQTGRYRVRFVGMSLAGGNVQVTAYGEDDRTCKVERWYSDYVDVRCFDATGGSADARYSVLFSRAEGGDGQAYAWSGNPAAAHYTPTARYAHNPAGGALEISHGDTGRYNVRFAGMNLGGGDVQVTAYGPDNRICKVASWGGDLVYVYCHDTTGRAADARFTVLFQPAETTRGGHAFLWANSPTAARYVPNARYAHNPAGGAIEVTRLARGVYRARFAYHIFAGGNVQVSAYGRDDRRCQVVRWLGDSINVKCFDSAGNPGDTRFTALYSAAIAPALTGWIDLHAHPMAHLAYGGKLIHGAPDVGSLLPADSSCKHNVRATSMEHALGNDNCTHGGWDLFKNRCGDDLRKQAIDMLQSENNAVKTPDRALGAPDFLEWPKWDDITHQKMWIDWIRRAHWGGLRVMVALATHNQTLAAAVSGPGDGPTDDKGSADLQLDEMIAFVGRHRDFMEIALTPADLRRIVNAGRLAVILGVEMDTIGGFGKGTNPTESQVSAEIHRLYRDKKVRYIFPVHVIDNKFAATAVYEKVFNVSNYREFGSFWEMACSEPGDNVSYNHVRDGFDARLALFKTVKLGMDSFRNPPAPPRCPEGTGHVNARYYPTGLTALGKHAIRMMMRLGMLIDIDHMSQAAANHTLSLAARVPGGGYPLNSGHSLYRGSAGTERSRTDGQLRAIAELGGIFGVGTEDSTPASFVANYSAVASRMGNRGVGLGTDMNGLVIGPRPSYLLYDGAFPRSRTGTRTWDYNRDGAAHYGLLPDFLKAVEREPGGAEVRRTLFQSAEHFAQTWEKCERQKVRVPG